MLNDIVQYHQMSFFYTQHGFFFFLSMVLIYPFSLLHQCKAADCPFLGRAVLYSEITSLVLKCPFL